MQPILPNACSVLAPYLTKPPLYEAKTDLALWNDPHIAQQMLKAHLDPNSDAASKRPATIEAAVNWVASMLSPGAAILDIGCGPGLYTSRWAQLGFEVTGIDFSENSIAYAKAHDQRSTYRLQDYLTLSDEAAFDIITLIWCDYGALVPEERATLLPRIRRALRPGGLFLLDFNTPQHYAEETDYTTWEWHPQGGFWSPKPHLCLRSEYFYEGYVGVGRCLVLEDDALRSYNIWQTCFSPQSLQEELTAAGFGEAQFFGDTAGSPPDFDGEYLCAVVREHH